MEAETLKERIVSLKNKLKETQIPNLSDTKNKLILILGLVITIPVLLTIKHLWPIYLLIGFWIAWLVKTTIDREKLGVIALISVIYIGCAYVISAVAAGKGLPALQRITVFSKWSLIKTLQVIAGYSSDPLIKNLHQTWLTKQILLVPILCAASIILHKAIKEKKNLNSDLHGSAKWDTAGETGFIGQKEGLLIGKEKEWPQRDIVIPKNIVNQHVILVGPPGAGKSTSIYIPNTLYIAQNGGYANLCITDPKMEILAVCGPELLKAGYKILIFNPVEPEISNAYNMLYYGDDFPKCDDIIQTIMSNVSEEGSKPSHWDEMVKTLLPLISYHLRLTLGEKANMSHLQAVAGAASPKDIEITLKNSPDPKVKQNALGFFNKMGDNDKITTSLMSNLPKWFKLWTLDTVRATTSINEIDFNELCSDQKVALFVVQPLDKVTQMKPLMATFFNQLFKKVQEKGRELGKLPRPLWFFLDEFANIGKVPEFTEFLTVVRGYNVGLVMGIQSISQLEDNYGKSKAITILNSCSTKICYPLVGINDAKYFSERIGDTTILTKEKAYNRTLVFREIETRESEKAVKRRLINPDEITSLDNEENLIVVTKKYRLWIRPTIYYKDKRWVELGQKCYSEKNLQERRKIFLRAVRGLPPLVPPGEEEMMREAALTTVERGSKVNKKVDKEAEEEKTRKTVQTADDEIALAFDFGLGNEEKEVTAQNENSSSPGENKAMPIDGKEKKEKTKKSNKLDLNSVEIVPMGNPFKNRK